MSKCRVSLVCIIPIWAEYGGLQSKIRENKDQKDSVFRSARKNKYMKLLDF